MSQPGIMLTAVTFEVHALQTCHKREISRCCSAVRPRTPASDPLRMRLQHDKFRCDKLWIFMSDSCSSLICSQPDMYKCRRSTRLPIPSGSPSRQANDDKFKYWSCVGLHNDRGTAFTLEHPDNLRCCRCLR